ncbi:MAG: hypothetical protein JXR96_29470 [Deltaproteobacteria bacterium]|nr:hypothetical protein [Deltaproteobacteria bacterium]
MTTKTIRTVLVFVFTTAAALCLCQCDLTNSALIELPDGNTLPWNGSLTIVAQLTEQGRAAKAGTATFKTTVGSFKEYDNYTTEPLQETTASVQGGEASTTLYSFPGEGGKEGTVYVEYVTVGKAKVTATETIFSAPGGMPSGRMFTALCLPTNASVYADSVERERMRIRCSVTVKTIDNQPVPRAEVKTLVEGGCTIALESVDTGTGDYVFSLQPNCEPNDVEPVTDEPNHMEEDYRIRNPRDGLLTIVFYTQGEEGFTDTNGNGIYDAGESFVGQDLAEPFIDINDNGERDEGEDFIDVNQDGQWSHADGRWNESTTIWASTRIMFTGAPHSSNDTTHFEPAGISIANGGSLSMTIHLTDINHNPIASNGTNDRIEFRATGAKVQGDNFIPLEDYMGVDFLIDGTIRPQSFTENRTYEVTLEDDAPGTDEAHTATLKTTVYWTPATSCSGYSPTAMHEELPDVTGTAH